MAAITLTVQVAGLAIAPAALCCVPAGAQESSMDCCENAGPGHVCPLMKKKKTSGQRESGDASLRSCCSPEDQILAALLGFLAVPVRPAPSLAAPPVAFAPIAATSSVLAWLAPVESPPPRA